MYEFTYDTYNNVSTSKLNIGTNTTYVDNYGYGEQLYISKMNEVFITVRAETESDAELKVKELVTRQAYELVGIKELGYTDE